MHNQHDKAEKLLNQIIIDSFCMQNFCYSDNTISKEYINLCCLSKRINNKAKLLKKVLSI